MLSWIKKRPDRKIDRHLAGYDVEITFKRVRNIILRLKPGTTRLYISAPHRISQKEIAQFIQSRTEWIEHHQAALQAAPPPSTTLREGDKCAVWGRPLQLVFTPKRRKAISYDLAYLYLPVGDVETVSIKLIERWYKQEAERAIQEILPYWLEQTQTHITKVTCRSMSSRWGSCSPTRRTIRLNSALAQYDLKYLEYVLVHELTHLYELGHNARFYGFMDQFLPDWRTRQRGLHHFHPTTQPSFLRD